MLKFEFRLTNSAVAAVLVDTGAGGMSERGCWKGWDAILEKVSSPRSWFARGQWQL